MNELVEHWDPHPSYDGIKKTAPIRNFLRRESLGIVESGFGCSAAALCILGILAPGNNDALLNGMFNLFFISGFLAGSVGTLDGLRRVGGGIIGLATDIHYNRKVKQNSIRR